MLVKNLTTTLILSTLTFSSAALAGMFFEPEDEDDGIWRIGGSAVFLNQSNNQAQIQSNSASVTNRKLEKGLLNNNVTFDDDDFVTSPLSNIPILNTDPDYHWGWGVDAAYIFPSLKYDIQGSYQQVNASKHADGTSTSAPPSNVLGGTTVIGTADESFNYDFNTAEITFGMYKKFNDRLMRRIGYGLGYANIEQRSNGSANFDIVTPFPPFNTILATNPTFKNSFVGGGPKITYDAQFDFIGEEDETNSLSIVAGAGFSLLFGESEATFNADDKVSGKGVRNSQEDDVIAVGFDGKIGLRYAQMVSREMSFYLEGGYEGVSYPNALQEGKIRNSNQVEDSGKASIATTITFDDEYYNYGPYIRFGMDFM